MTEPKYKVNHYEKTEKRNIDKTRESTLKPTRCFLFFAHRTFFKKLSTHTAHIAKAPRPDTTTNEVV